MKFTAFAHELRRRRPLAVAAAILSALVCAVVAYHVTLSFPPDLKSREYHVGVATARILVNTPSSIVANLQPAGGDSLPIHAQLLGDLVASESVRDAIAKSAGISAKSLVVRPPSVGGVVQTTLATSVVAAPGAATLTVDADPALPIVSIEAQAATPALAAALANASVAALQSYVQSVASSERIPSSSRPVITSLGTAQGIEETRGIRPLYGIVAAVILFAFCCYAIVFVGGLRDRVRAAAIAAAPGPARNGGSPSAVHTMPGSPAPAESEVVAQPSARAPGSSAVSASVPSVSALAPAQRVIHSIAPLHPATEAPPSARPFATHDPSLTPAPATAAAQPSPQTRFEPWAPMIDRLLRLGK